MEYKQHLFTLGVYISANHILQAKSVSEHCDLMSAECKLRLWDTAVKKCALIA